MKTYNEICDNLDELVKEDSKLSGRVAATEKSIEDLTEFAGQASEIMTQIGTKVSAITYNPDVTNGETTVGSNLAVSHDIRMVGDIELANNSSKIVDSLAGSSYIKFDENDYVEIGVETDKYVIGNGKITVNGTEVGGQKLYIHNINLYRQLSTDYWYLNLQIINTQSTAFTSHSDIATFLADKGFNGITKPYIANGSHFTSSAKYEITGIIVSTGTLYPVMFDLSVGEDIANTYLPAQASVTDTVIEIS